MQSLHFHGIIVLAERYDRYELIDARKLLRYFKGGYPTLEKLLNVGGMFYIHRANKSHLVSRKDMFSHITPAEHDLQKAVLRAWDTQADEEFELLRREVDALVDHYRNLNEEAPNVRKQTF